MTRRLALSQLRRSATEAEIEARHKAAWAKGILPASEFGLAYWQKFADEHGKPLTIPEWGLIQRPDPNNRGGLDDPYYIRRMYEYIQSPNHHVYFASYFYFDAQADGNSRIFRPDSTPVQFPKSTALYRQLFSLPVSSPAQSSPAPSPASSPAPSAAPSPSPQAQTD